MLNATFNSIIKTNKNIQLDPFWDNCAKDLLTGITLALFEDATEEEINFESIINMLNSTNNGKDLLQTYINSKDKRSTIYTLASVSVNSAVDTKASIYSTLKQKLNPLVSRQSYKEIFNNNSFNFETLKDKKNAIFLITKDENLEINFIANIIINQIITYLLQNTNYLKLENKFNLILDNFETLNYFEGFKEYLNISLSRNFSNYIILRNLDSLIQTYGKEVLELELKLT